MPLRKTKTIKERAIYVYLPSHEMVRHWKKRANEAEVSISKFVIEHVQNSINQEEPGFEPRTELIKRLRTAEEETQKLRSENKMLRSAYERLDEELKHYRAKPFLEENFTGLREYSRELIETLRKKGTIPKDELLETLGIDPRNTDLVRALTTQLKNLQAYGLVEETLRGWRWR